MWEIFQEKNGRFRCYHSKTEEVTDGTWASKEEAQRWADERNESYRKLVEENKARAAARKAKRAALEESLPTDFLTSRGDGWEGKDYPAR